MRGVTGKYFLISPWNICCGYSLELPQQGASNEYHNVCFHGEIRKISILFGWKNMPYLEMYMGSAKWKGDLDIWGQWRPHISLCFHAVWSGLLPYSCRILGHCMKCQWPQKDLAKLWQWTGQLLFDYRHIKYIQRHICLELAHII